jgi:hypothetical protein
MPVLKCEFEKRLLGNVESPKGVGGPGQNCIMGSFMICAVHRVLIRVIKSRTMRWAGNVARMGEKRNVYGFWLGNRKERTT